MHLKKNFRSALLPLACFFLLMLAFGPDLYCARVTGTDAARQQSSSAGNTSAGAAGSGTALPFGLPSAASRPPVNQPATGQSLPDARSRTITASPPRNEATIERGRNGERWVNIDFDDVDIAVFIKFISELTGRNFVVDKRVKGKVTVISPTKISEDEAYKVFESVLEVNDFTAVEAGDVVKIVPSPDARTRDVETRLHPSSSTREDKVITQIIPLSYANPTEVKKVFQPLIDKSSVMVSYDPSNTLIITGYQSNIQRLLRILSVIDVPGLGSDINVIPLENAVAADMVKTISQLFQQKAGAGKRADQSEAPRLVADERTNSIVVLATGEDVEKIKQLVGRLDREMPRGKGKIHVYYLQNATAEEVVKVLEKLSSGASKSTDSKKPAETPVISKNVQISADKATNSLIITADQDDYRILEDVIQKLDVPRSMVYIEALIMEVTTDKDFQLGVEWKVGNQFTVNDGDAVVFSGSGGGGTDGAYDFFPSASTTQLDGKYVVDLPSAFSLGIMGDAITIGDFVFPNIGAVLRAYKNDSDVHILSAPQLLTTNNQEAEIVVGKNVPYATKQETTSTTTIDYTTYEYRDVGISLKITPQISQERLVRLNVFQEVKRIIEKESSTDRPTTYKRSTTTTVIVKDGSTIVIGGLIDQSTEGGSYKVPCLGDIPGLGNLFKSVFEKRQKTNLYVFLTPHIIETPKEAAKVFDKKRQEIHQIEEEAVKQYERRGDLNLSFDSLTLEGMEPESALPPKTLEAPAANAAPEKTPAEAPVQAPKVKREAKPVKKAKGPRVRDDNPSARQPARALGRTPGISSWGRAMEPPSYQPSGSTPEPGMEQPVPQQPVDQPPEVTPDNPPEGPGPGDNQ